MLATTSALNDYKLFAQSHADRFDSEVTLIQEQIERQVKVIQEQETSLVQQQRSALDCLHQAIATEARCLLGLPEFRQYVQDTQTADCGWSSKKKEPIDLDPLTWRIYHSDDAIQISDYREHEDRDAYDDEQTYVSYGYTVKVVFGPYSETLYETTLKRVYGLHNARSHSLTDQRKQLESSVGDLYYDAKLESTVANQLSQELSYLVGYACQLLTLKPRQVELSYATIVPEENV